MINAHAHCPYWKWARLIICNEYSRLDNGKIFIQGLKFTAVIEVIRTRPFLPRVHVMQPFWVAKACAHTGGMPCGIPNCRVCPRPQLIIAAWYSMVLVPTNLEVVFSLCVMSRERTFSQYYAQLEPHAKQRYKKKLDSIGRQVDDPYTFGTGLKITEAQCLPDIEYPDIYNFLINTRARILKRS